MHAKNLEEKSSHAGIQSLQIPTQESNPLTSTYAANQTHPSPKQSILWICKTEFSNGGWADGLTAQCSISLAGLNIKFISAGQQIF